MAAGDRRSGALRKRKQHLANRKNGMYIWPDRTLTRETRFSDEGPRGVFSFLSGVRQMAVPKRKTSRMKRGNRRSADALVAPTYVEDKDSGELRRPHHIDLKSGKYRGRQILEPQEEI